MQVLGQKALQLQKELEKWALYLYVLMILYNPYAMIHDASSHNFEFF